MTLKQIAAEWAGRTVPYPVPDPNKLQGQCVQFIRWLLDNYWHLPQWKPNPGACGFWKSYDTDPAINKHFAKIPNTPAFVPKEGDIVIWSGNKGGGYGHIGVVYGEAQGVRTLTCLESNWKPLVVSVVTHNYNDVLGFFRVKGAA